MANLNTSNFNSFKPGILNVSTTSQPLSEGFLTNGTSVYVEDGNGVKSGLKLGAELVECIEPVTKSGVTNVTFCDRTYATLSAVKLLSTALEIYRSETKLNITDLITPLTKTIDNVEISTRDLATRIDVIDSFTTSFTEANLLTRTTQLEQNYLSKLGGRMEGDLTFKDKTTLDLGYNRITNVAPPVNSRDATNKEYVDQAIAALEARLRN